MEITAVHSGKVVLPVIYVEEAVVDGIDVELVEIVYVAVETSDREEIVAEVDTADHEQIVAMFDTTHCCTLRHIWLIIIL